MFNKSGHFFYDFSGEVGEMVVVGSAETTAGPGGLEDKIWVKVWSEEKGNGRKPLLPVSVLFYSAVSEKYPSSMRQFNRQGAGSNIFVPPASCPKNMHLDTGMWTWACYVLSLGLYFQTYKMLISHNLLYSLGPNILWVEEQNQNLGTTLPKHSHFIMMVLNFTSCKELILLGIFYREDTKIAKTSFRIWAWR